MGPAQGAEFLVPGVEREEILMRQTQKGADWEAGGVANVR